MKQLSVINGPDRGSRIQITDLPIRIGRDAKNQVVLHDALVSRVQAVIESGSDHQLLIRDQGSTNGTEINGKRLQTATLRTGDIIHMGGTVLLYSDAEDARTSRGDRLARTMSGTDSIVDSLQRFDPVELLRSHRALHAIYQADGIATTVHDPVTLCQKYLELFVGAVRGEEGTVHLIEHVDEEPTRVAEHPVGGEPHISQTVLDMVLESGTALLVRDPLGDARLNASASIISANLRSILAVPLQARDRVLGVVQVVSMAVGRRFGEEDLRLLTALSGKLASALETARLYSELNELFLSTTRTLVEALEAKDPYTRGHSERVARYALLLAKELDYSKDARTDLFYAAIFHDIGKIGMPDRILHSTDRLSDEEFELVKQHPVVGARLLDKFPGLKGAVPGIRHHHENFDGSGYPDRIAGDDIPESARIIALADTFDAMTTDRAYRKGRSPAESIAVIREESGRRFDPGFVDRFITAIERAAGPAAVEFPVRLVGD